MFGEYGSLLDQLPATLLLSAYQAGKLVAIGVYRGEITLTWSINFERPMGIARNQGSLAVGGATGGIRLLDEVPDIAASN